jgi:hypothetical protein
VLTKFYPENPRRGYHLKCVGVVEEDKIKMFLREKGIRMRT